MRTKYPNKLEIALGVVFLGSLLATAISASVDYYQNKFSYGTMGCTALVFASGYGAFRREN